MTSNVAQHGRVLFVTKDDSRATFVRESLGSDFQVCVFDEGENMARVIEELAPDLVIVDVSDAAALDMFTALKAALGSDPAPVVVMSDDDDIQTRAFELGATDCLRGSLAPRVFKWKIHNLISGIQTLDNLEESLAEAYGKIEELESFLQMVAHDLKSPAAAVCGFVRLLKRSASRMPVDERIDEILIHLSNASNTIQEFLQDVAAFSVMEHLELDRKQFNVKETALEVIERHRHTIAEKEIELKLSLGIPGLKGVGDTRRLQQVLDNLLRNALFHMGEAVKPFISVSVTEDNDFVVMTVTDNGVGIPDEFKERVFDKYFRVPRRDLQPGTGLGLFIAKCIVENHGGRIWIESPQGKGTSVSFSFPKHASSV